MRIRICLVLLSLSFLLVSCQNEVQETISEIPSEISDTEKEPTVTIKDLGVPFGEKYSTLPEAIRPADMIVFDGNLYLGCGDYTGNRGPIDMWRYSLSENEWEISGVVRDEAIHRFNVINGVLMAPGIDPKDAWSMGNIYVLKNDEWITKRTVTSSVHCFDLESFDGKIFAATHLSNGYQYVAVSHDNGETFANIPMMKNGEYVTGDNHYYDVMTIGGKLYAFCDNELYEYTENGFEYVESLFYGMQMSGLGMRAFWPIYADEEVNGKHYFATGNLYACTNVDDLHYVNVDQSIRIHDLYQYNGELFALSVTNNKGKFINAVYKIVDESLEKVFEFEHDALALTFAVYENSFYLGMMSNDYPNPNENDGRVLQVTIE